MSRASEAENVRVIYLADRPDLVTEVAAWVFAQWGHLTPGNTLERVVGRFQGNMNRDALPITLAAMCEDRPIGTTSLVMQDMHTRPEFAPWLASVYVLPEYRNHGIGSLLVRAAEEEGRRLGLGWLHLFTPDRESFYARLGWIPVERTEYRGEMVVLMARCLDSAKCGTERGPEGTPKRVQAEGPDRG